MTEKAQINPEKLKVLSAVMDKIEKDFGKGAIMKLGDKSKNMDVETVPTGSAEPKASTYRLSRVDFAL